MKVYEAWGKVPRIPDLCITVSPRFRDPWRHLRVTQQSPAREKDCSDVVRCSFRLQMSKYAVTSLQRSEYRQGYLATKRIIRWSSCKAEFGNDSGKYVAIAKCCLEAEGEGSWNRGDTLDSLETRELRTSTGIEFPVLSEYKTDWASEPVAKREIPAHGGKWIPVIQSSSHTKRLH
jgi:hypothetical protein